MVWLLEWLKKRCPSDHSSDPISVAPFLLLLPLRVLRDDSSPSPVRPLPWPVRRRRQVMIAGKEGTGLKDASNGTRRRRRRLWQIIPVVVQVVTLLHCPATISGEIG